MTHPDSNIPVPDPSLLTTEQLRRELGSLREVLETRLDGMDRATALIAGEVIKYEADFERRLAYLREVLQGLIDSSNAVNGERFAGVAQRFTDLAERTAQAAEEGLRSLDAALAAQKEAVSEQNTANTRAISLSNEGTTKEIDALKALIGEVSKGLEGKISSLINQFERMQGRSTGEQSTRIEQRAERTEQRLNINAVLAAVTVVVGIVGLIIAATVYQGV